VTPLGSKGRTLVIFGVAITTPKGTPVSPYSTHDRPALPVAQLNRYRLSCLRKAAPLLRRLSGSFAWTTRFPALSEPVLR